jgi:GntR family transcriptional regulator/MocR family aminotransferase
LVLAIEPGSRQTAGVDLYLDPDLKRGVAEALFEQIRAAVTSGRLAVGDRLPPTRELATQLGVSRQTVTTVYGRLVAEGYLEGRAGGGTFVCGTAVPQSAPPVVSVLRPVTPLRRSTPPQPPIAGGFDLRIGRTDPALFPLVEWRQCVTAALQQSPESYGDPAGLIDLRRALAHWVGRSRGVETPPEHVVVTGGAQQAVDLVTRVLLRPGDHVAIEEPGYPAIRHAWLAAGLRVTAVPVDHEGLVVDRIPADVRMIYTTPSHQAPTGVTMSLSRRRALLDFAEAHDAAVIEDDYDSEHRHSDRPLEPLFRLDRSGRVLYVGTFAKNLAASLRLGFLVLPGSLVEAVIAWRELIDVQPPGLTQQALHRFITEGRLERHLRRTRRVYRERHDLVRTTVGEWVDDGLVGPGPQNHAGLHVSALLPDGGTEAAVHAAARKEQVALSSYGECVTLPTTPAGLLVGFGLTPVERLPDALAALRRALEASLRPGSP